MKNLCTNPYLAYRIDGWRVGGTQAAATDLTGFDRPRGIRITGSTNTFSECPKIAVTAGVQYTGSVSVRTTWVETVRTYLDYYNETGSYLGDSGVTLHDVESGDVVRVGSTATVPSGATHLSMSVHFNPPTTGDVLDISMHRLDTGTDTAYFDGDSPGWQWAGPVGESESESESVADVRLWNGTGWVDTRHRVYTGMDWSQ